MEKTKAKTNNTGGSVLSVVGMLFIGFGIVDFASSWMGTNLTAFLGPLSQFTPLAAGLTGAMFLNLGNKSE